MLVLAFDTATSTPSCALVRDGDVLGERTTNARTLLVDVQGLLADVRSQPDDVDGIAVGVGPGSYTGLRMGLVTARALSLALGVPVAGVSTLAALAAGAPDALPVIDARRGEIFTLAPDPVCLHPDELAVEPGRTCVGDGAVRHRATLEQHWAEVPPDGDQRHAVAARHHAFLARDFGPAHLAAPLYLRVPDADRAIAVPR